MPRLAEAVERLADGVEGKRDPTVDELISYAGDLVEAAERVLSVQVAPGSGPTRDAFDNLRGFSAAVKRILVKIEGGRR